MSGRGGYRPGAGRPKGTTNAALGRESTQRPQHQVRSTPEEWELVKEFNKLTRTHFEECRAFVEKYTKE